MHEYEVFVFILRQKGDRTMAEIVWDEIPSEKYKEKHKTLT